MPICDKPSPAAAPSKSVAAVDDHASEAAKTKRTREQAYFNSYDFDAIAVLPEQERAEDEQRHAELGNTVRSGGGGTSRYQRRQQPFSQTLLPPVISNSVATLDSVSHPKGTSSTSKFQGPLRTPSQSHSPGQLHSRRLAKADPPAFPSRDHSLAGGSGETTDSSGGGPRKYSFLQQLGEFFIQNRQAADAATDAVALANKSDSQPVQPRPLAGGTAVHVDGGNFLLPRAMLKYQSSSSNSMPSAANATTTTTIATTTTTTAPPPPQLLTLTTATTTATATTTTITSTVVSNAKSFPSANRGSNNNINSATTRSSNNKAKQQQMHAISNEKGTRSSTLTSHKKTAAAAEAAEAEAALGSTITGSTARSTEQQQQQQNVAESQAELIALRNGQTSQQLTTKMATQQATTTATTTATATASPPTAAAAAETRSPDAAHQAEPHECSGSHQSHYSTDKSGSSGYYSSNVCSTYSIEDHIYSEPVIDVLHLKSGSRSKSVPISSSSGSGSSSSNNNNKSRKQRAHMNSNSKKKWAAAAAAARAGAGAGAAVTLESRAGNRYKNVSVASTSDRVVGEKHSDDDDDCDCGSDCDGDDDDDGEHKHIEIPVSPVALHKLKINPLLPAPPHLSENLRILESSIEKLDRHLKTLPGLSCPEHVTAFVHTTHHNHVPPADEEHKMRASASSSCQQLPTIKEGYDDLISCERASNRPPSRPQWTANAFDLADDSLLDIDLDSFLLVSERRPAARRSSHHHSGIDNPTFLPPTADELEENNYKCVKYINSCPEDAYRVESDIGVGVGVGVGSASQKSSCIEHCMRRYEDQLHFQSTRELLEDVRDKIRLLSRSSSESDHPHSALCSEGLPPELSDMIGGLRHELEVYLARMNQHSELEIRQLCSGLVKSQHIVKMKKAFERRHSIASLSACDGVSASEAAAAARSGGGGGGVDNTLTLVTSQPATTIRSACDPNFKMKRKSLAEIFPVSDLYAGVKSLVGASESEPRIHAAGDTNAIVAASRTQLQRNLSFHQPTLNQLDVKAGGGGGGGGGIGGGGIGGGGLGGGLTAGNIHSTNSANVGSGGSGSGAGESGGDKDAILEWHRKRPSAWQMYYGTNRMSQSLLGKRGLMSNSSNQATLSYPSSRPESDFTLDLPRAEQLRIKMEKEKKFRQRCRYITSLLSLVFFLLTVMVVSLVLTRGKRMFGSMI